MISEQLQDFLTSFCGADEDLTETSRILRADSSGELRSSMIAELDMAIHDRSISPELAEYLMARRFDSSEAVAEWLSSLRDDWLGP